MSTASHVNCNLLKFQRSLISQLRLHVGILPIQIETGRFVGLDKEDRICQLCTSNEIEDEAHFLLYCDLHAAHRQEFETGIEEKFSSVFKHPYILGRCFL